MNGDNWGDGPVDLRGCGTTRRILESMPATGGIFIVHDRHMVGYVLSMIEDLIPRLKDVVDVREVTDVGQVDRLRGIERPIFIDHSFWDEIRGPVAIGVNEAAIRARRYLPQPAEPAKKPRRKKVIIGHE